MRAASVRGHRNISGASTVYSTGCVQLAGLLVNDVVQAKRTFEG